MTKNFERKPENLTDPSRVRNFLKDIKNDAERKQYSTLFHIVYALICSVCVFLACDSMQNQGISLLFLFVAPSMCVFTFLYSPVIVKVLPVVLPLPMLVASFALSGTGLAFLPMSSALFMYILCILSAAVITKAVLSGYTKTVLFTCLCVVFGVICFCQIMFSFIINQGTFSFSLLLDTINSGFDNIIKQSIALTQTPEGLEAFRALAVEGKTLSDEQITKLVKDSIKLSVDIVKPLLPSFFALSCMLYGFITVAVFSLFANHFRINVFVCIMDENWTYRPSLVSSAVYDIIFFVFILSMFVNFPPNISATVTNLMFVLTPLMFISGVRGIYTMLYKKNKNQAKSRIITAIIVIAATFLLGGVTLLIIGSAGVTFITSRNREERLAIPLVYAADLRTLQKLSEDANQDPETQSTDNTKTDNQ